MRRLLLLLLLVLVSFVTTPTNAFAEDGERQTIDVVYLRNGTEVRGQVTELIPDDHVTIVVDGEAKRFTWSEVDRVISMDAPPVTNNKPPPPPVKPATPPKLDAPPAESPPPQPQWRPNTTLLTTGAIMFGVGYGVPAATALPSTVGLLGRVVILVLTIGLPCLFNNDDDYLCDGDHGSVQMLIPFVGPILFAENHPKDSVINSDGRGFDSEVKVALYASSFLQIAGLATMVTGLVLGKTSLPDPAQKKRSDTGPKLHVAPLEMPYAAGLTVGVHRW